eukprot:4998446-Prymnesium_polylepis.2
MNCVTVVDDMKSIINAAVAEDTSCSSSSSLKTGLMICPPPSPSIPAPIDATPMNTHQWRAVGASHATSPLMRLDGPRGAPGSALRSSARWASSVRPPRMGRFAPTTKKKAAEPHCSPMRDGAPWPPLSAPRPNTSSHAREMAAMVPHGSSGSGGRSSSSSFSSPLAPPSASTLRSGTAS